jgi:beta-galactosidase
LSQLGDAFLDMRGWGKGIVFVNGHNLGRYWYIGPQQTLYLPGVWLKQGRNEIVVFEQLKDDVHSVAGIKTPILDQLNKDENAPSRGPMKEPKLTPASLVKEGRLADSRAAQDILSPRKRRATFACKRSHRRTATSSPRWRNWTRSMPPANHFPPRLENYLCGQRGKSCGRRPGGERD